MSCCYPARTCKRQQQWLQRFLRFYYPEKQHSTVRISNASSISANSLSAASNNKAFQSQIKLKRFDESLQMNVFILHADGGITCLLCSKHPAFTIAQGKNGYIYTTEPARPPRPNRLDYHLSSDQHQKDNSLEKN